MRVVYAIKALMPLRWRWDKPAKRLSMCYGDDDRTDEGWRMMARFANAIFWTLAIVCLLAWLTGCTSVQYTRTPSGDVSIRYNTLLKKIDLSGMEFSKDGSDVTLGVDKYGSDEAAAIRDLAAAAKAIAEAAK